MSGFWFIVEQVVRGSDMVLFILDARLPELSKNLKLEAIIERLGKRVFLVFNKIDLIGSGARERLEEQYPDAFFVSGVKNQGIKGIKTRLMIEGKRAGNPEPKVAIVGYPNVGKSAIINALAHRARAPVSSKAGTTRGVQFVRAGSLKILDTPGVIPLEDTEPKLGLLAAKNPEKLKNPEQVAFDVIKMMLEMNKPALEKYAGQSIDAEDPYELLLQIGKRKGLLKKGGDVDETKTAIGIVRDWQRGKLRS